MKTRFYKRNVIDGEKRLKEFGKNEECRYMMCLTGFVFCVFLIFTIIFTAVFWLGKYYKSAFLTLVFIPFIVKWILTELQTLYYDHKTIELLKLDKTRYDKFMQIQMTRTFPDSDWKSAVEIFRLYRQKYNSSHDELLKLLKNELEMKPANPLNIAVVAGLLFACGEKKDYSVLFGAKYRHGAAGQLIPDIHIRILDPKEDSLYELHKEKTIEFLNCGTESAQNMN